MPPRPKKHQETDPNQGAFIAAEMLGNGGTDPQSFGLIGRIIGVEPDGFFPDQAPPSTDEAITPEAHLTTTALKEQHTAKRRRAQIGKHSPLQRDGTYMTLMLGDVLPPNENLGREKPLIVKEGNYADAKRYAAALECIRLERIRANPTLDAVRVSDVIQFVADGFDLNKALDAARNIPRPVEEPKDELPRFNTLRARLKLVIDDADAARFVPASRSEINVVLPLIDHNIRSDGPVARGAAHNHLVETASASKKERPSQGL
ncbi:hypothetical protein IPL68_02310 [Candidatus Saccharibacteria bacterium]|nr:MAG: hypothetical protein IPL68_02310 [Candidatus Saccharibacteria bacterium]